MFREMRRKKQALRPEDCARILAQGTSGVLPLLGDDGYPYAVPLSYVYHEGRVYFHSAMAGHKLDAVRRNKKVSFCVIDRDTIVPEEYTSYFRSVIVFGEMRILEDEAEKWSAMERLSMKYAREDSPENRRRAIEKDWAPLCVLELAVVHMSGKEAIELVREKEKNSLNR